MSPREHFHGVVAALHPVIHGVPDGALGRPTPCADYDVRGLVGHLLGTSEALRRFGAGEPPDRDDPWGTSGVELTESWRSELGRRLDGLADAWARTEAWEGDAMDGAVSREALGQMAYAELLLHGWDLAVATGQDYRPDDDSVRRSLGFAGSVGDDPEERAGLYGPVVPVPADAPLLHRLLGATGRDPGWQPR